ncbi:RNA-binding protein [Candidatus Bathyarchaeota archaeon]|nr:RNA-binding protein [Candidatus Bathyarchaeota archaeon]
MAELDFIMHQLYPDHQFNYGKTIVKGLIWGNVIDVDPVEVISRLKDFINTMDFKLQFILKLVPIQEVLETNLQELSAFIQENMEKIGPSESFKIVVRKRRVNLHSIDIIDEIAKDINRNVDLDNPDKIIRLEIIGKYTGISILEKGQIFSLGRKIF